MAWLFIGKGSILLVSGTVWIYLRLKKRHLIPGIEADRVWFGKFTNVYHGVGVFLTLFIGLTMLILGFIGLVSERF